MRVYNSTQKHCGLCVAEIACWRNTRQRTNKENKMVVRWKGRVADSATDRNGALFGLWNCILYNRANVQ